MSAEQSAEGKAHTATFLDTIWMRFLALIIAVAGVALFVVANQDFLAELLAERTGGAASAYEQCVEERMTAVRQVAEEAGYTAKQLELAEIRAREFCRNQTGG